MKRTINKPVKNYIILIILFLIVIFVYSTFIRIYRVNKIANSSVLINTIATISFADFDNYIVENPSSLIYMPSLEKNNNHFEQEFLKIIIDKHLEEKVVYLNIGSYNYNRIKNKILINDKKLSNETAIIMLFKDEKLFDLLEITEDYNIDNIKKFIEKGDEVLDDD